MTSQRRDTGFVLPDGCGAVAASPVEIDEEPVALLPRGVEGQQALSQLDGVTHRAGRGPRGGGRHEPIAQQPPESGALVGQPLVEGILSDTEPLEQLTRAVPPEELCVALLEHRHVHLDDTRVEVDGAMVVRDHVVAEDPPQRRNTLPQVVPSPRLVHVSPEQPGQVLTGVAAAGRQSEVGEEPLGLLARQLQGPTLSLQVEPTQEEQAKTIPSRA